MNYYYYVTVYTGEISGGGTDANVYIEIFGTNGGHLCERLLDLKDHDDFETGMNDTYTITSTADIGKISKIIIRHDNKNKNANWYLDGVTVKAQNTEYYFPAYRWLAKDKGDGSINVTLYPGTRQVHYEYLGDDKRYPNEKGQYPSDRENGWSHELQGVCHDNSNWFFTQNGNLWKFPIGHDLNNKVTSANNSKGIYKVSTSYHLGDIDHYQGYVFVPVSNKTARICAYKADKLTLTATSYMKKANGEYHNDCGWLAINPNSGFLYTSDGELNSNSPILIYKINMTALKQGKDFLTYHSCLTVRDNDGSILKRSCMQGGCFDNENHLHINNGSWKGNANNSGGISVFSVVQNPVKNSNTPIYRLTHSNQDRDFRYQFNSIGEEPEGITYWDLDENNKAPYIRGQLHAIMLDNTGKGDDDFYFKHYRRV